MADHLHPKGTVLKRSTNGSAYTTIGDLVSVMPPGITVGKSADANLSSTHLFDTPGWITLKDAPFAIYMHQTEMDTLFDYAVAGTTLYWRVEYPLLPGHATSGRWDFQGWISDIDPSQAEEVGSDNKYRTSVTVTPVTIPTFTAGAA